MNRTTKWIQWGEKGEMRRVFVYLGFLSHVNCRSHGHKISGLIEGWKNPMQCENNREQGHNENE